MDPISQSDSGKVLSHYSKSTSIPAKPASTPQDGTSVSITDPSSLTSKAQEGSELRLDVIEKAKKLLSDPNWPNDNQLEKLSDKLLSSEDFS